MTASAGGRGPGRNGSTASNGSPSSGPSPLSGPSPAPPGPLAPNGTVSPNGRAAPKRATIPENGAPTDLPAQRRYFSVEPSQKITTGFQRYERPIYDYPTKAAPCRAGCPAGHDIAWALYLVSEGRDDLAEQAFREDSPFPAITGRVCYHPCESVCNRGGLDEPIAIHALERAFGDRGFTTGSPAARRYSETVGVVGSGPAGLTAAYHLNRLGYSVIVYEAQERPGGVLAFGIPEYRLPSAVLSRELERLAASGIEFRCGVHIGGELSFEKLRERHQAVFLGVGLSRPRSLHLATPEDPRVQAALPFLQGLGCGRRPELAGPVAVLGGGDVAIDAARTALRLGASEVTVCYPEAEGQLPAHPEEVAAAVREGVLFRSGVLLSRMDACGSGLELRFAVVRSVRRSPNAPVTFETGAEEASSSCFSHVLYAVGQSADFDFLPEPLRSSRVLLTGPWGETAAAGVFAGGDAAGTYNVVNAVAAGKRAAIGMDLFLRGYSPEGLRAAIQVGPSGALSMQKYLAWRRGEPEPAVRRLVSLSEINLDYFPPAARPEPGVAGGPRGSFDEVNQPLPVDAAVSEARRCFHCGVCNMCGNCFRYCPDSSVIQSGDWGFRIDTDHCKGCGICVQECPRAAMSMVPESAARESPVSAGKGRIADE